MAEETTANNPGTAGEETPPSTVDEQAPSVVAENIHSTNEPETTEIPSANAPDPATVNPETTPAAAPETESERGPNQADTGAKAKQTAKKDAPKEGKPAAAKAAKKEKGPAVEDKPFADFMQQDYLPALKAALAKQGAQDVELSFAKQKIPVAGFNPTEECWQVMGRWDNGLRQFNLYFPEENIQGKRAFSCNEGSKPSTIEPFLIDERKITLDLMVFGVMQRLNGQKWLARN